MHRSKALKTILAGSVCALALAGTAFAQTRSFDVPAGDLKVALDTYIRQSGTQLIYRSDDVRGKKTLGVHGALSSPQALDQLLAGSGFVSTRDPSGAVVVARVPPGGAAASPASEAPQVTEVVVTGTHIRGGNPTSPVRLIGRANIEQSGYSQVGDLVRSLPESFSGGQNPEVIGGAGTNAENNNISGASTINLRGLGTGATLVLLNGHRLSADAIYQGADVSGIPLAALERVEVVTDGASALYGSDAVAGVVNFIIRKNFDGGELSARVGGGTQGGGLQQSYNALVGTSRDKWHALANVEYSRQEEIRVGERSFTAGAPAVNSLLPRQERRSLFLSAGADLTDSVQISIDGLLDDRDVYRARQTSPTASISTYSIYTPAYSVASTIDVALPNAWKAHVTGLFAGSRNEISQSTTTRGVISFNTPRYSNNVKSIEATADGTALALPTGELRVALGGGLRREEFKIEVPSASFLRNPDRTVGYAYAELLVPIVSSSKTRVGLRELEISLAGRIEDYSDFGSATNPKVGVRYVPVEDLTIRGTWGKSFKAPPFYQTNITRDIVLFNASTLGYPGPGLALDTQGGNPDLKAEKSTSWTFGGDYSPSFNKAIKFSATYFDINYKDRVVNPVTDALAFSNPIFAPFIEYSPSAERQAAVIAQFGTFSNASGATYDPSKVVGIVYNQYQNVAAQSVTGVDFAYDQAFEISSGTLSTFLNASWMKLRRQTVPNAPTATLSGTVFNPPKFRARGGLNWKSGDLSATAIVNYVAGETDDGVTPHVSVDSWTTVDATVAYRFPQTSGLGQGLRVAVSASNLFDRDPPRAVSPATAVTGVFFDSTNYSVLGRVLSLTVAKAW